MRDQLLLLVELQSLDLQLAGLAEKKQQLPQRLLSYEVACTQELLQLERLQTAMGQGERQQRALERELTESHGALTKIQAKLREVKTNKEYSAILAEVAAAKQRIATLEDHVLQLMEQTEQHHHTIHLQEQRVQAARQTLEEQTSQIQAAQESLNHDVASTQKQRQKTVAALDAKLYEIYQQLATRYGGHALARLHEGVCAGCHLRISPQLVADIRLQQKLYTCPHCRLMLVSLD